MRAKFDPLSIRVRPPHPWERHRETWDDILNEMIDKHGVEELNRRVTKVEEELRSMHDLLKRACALALSNQQLIGDILESQVNLTTKLSEKP